MNKKLPLLILIILVSLISCKKKSGCTEYFAENYDPEAAIDDGSCITLGSMIFYASLANEKLDLFINDELIGTIQPSSILFGLPTGFGFGFNEPNCNDPFGLVVEKTTGNYTLIVKGSNTIRKINVSNTVQCNAIDINF